MSVTPNMNLDLPVPTVTLGPEYATQNNEAFETIDLHDHSSGKGVKVPVAGLNINANLNFNSFKPYSLLSAQFNAQAATLTGAANANSIYSVNGNLYWTNASGTAIQITNGGAIVSTPGAVEALEYDTINTNLTINSGDAYVFIALDTSASRTITLPLASSVADGRIYIIKDSTGDANANPITFTPSGADLIDGEASLSFDSSYGSISLIGDGVSNWYVW